ncbi:NAD(P)-dependent dehydrogenase (short-subunit alcohol dehydrogenase family) [Sphingomonas sp. UYAg733]
MFLELDMAVSRPHVIIIGGTSGIGLAAAQRLAKQGAMLTVVGRDPTRLTNALAAIGGDARSEVGDSGDRAVMDALFNRVGPFDHLVIAASGGRGGGSFADVDGDLLRQAFDAKFWAHWNSAQAALPFLSTDGSITFVTAASSRIANPGTSGLAAINGALERMVPTLARELAPRRVNAVSPGVIDTPWWADKPRESFEQQSGRAPLRRAGRPEEVADGIAFLIGNAFVTGIVLDVDGGLHLM